MHNFFYAMPYVENKVHDQHNRCNLHAAYDGKAEWKVECTCHFDHFPQVLL